MKEDGLAGLRSYGDVEEYFRPGIPDCIRQRVRGRIDVEDARRIADRLPEFPAIRTAVKTDVHFMFIRIVEGQVPSRDKTADYRHVLEAAYCEAILVEDQKLLTKVPLLNPDLRALSYPLTSLSG